MASGGAKNVIFTIVIIAALGGAVYGIMNSMGSGGSEQEQAMRHFVDPASLENGDPSGVSMTVEEFRKRAAAKNPVVTPNGSTDVIAAGVCPSDGKYYGLIGHGEMPETCPHCGTSLEGYDVSGNKVE